MKEPLASKQWSLLVEYLFCVAIFIGLIYTFWFYYSYQYLPQPFFYEPSGTFMDWYSLSFWANFRGAYDVAGSIYPPLTFVLMRIFSLPHCYPNASGEPSRECDPVGIIALGLILVCNIVLTFVAFRKIDKSTYIPRGIALSMGFPMLYTFERGNVLLFCYTCFLLAFGPLLKSARLRWFFGGLTLNFKVYLIAVVLAPVLRRRWIQTEGILIWAVIIYGVTWMILGEGSPGQVYANVTSYAEGFGATRVLDMWYAASFVPAISILKGENFPILAFVDSRSVGYLLLMCNSLVLSSQVMIVFAAIATWLKPGVVPPHRTLYFGLSMALLSSEAGGYTEILLFFLVFQERWKGYARPLAILIAYLLCIPGDYVIDRVNPIARWSYLAGTDVIADYGIGVLAILRPILKVFMIWCLTSITIRDVWVEINKTGWNNLAQSFSTLKNRATESENRLK